MHKQTKQLYVFGPFRLDTDERLLMRDGRVAPLPPKVFDTLLVLVENSGRVVSKDELMQSLWPETFVEESNLTQNISQLRRALGDGAAEAQYIETIPKRGYRFVASVQPSALNGVSTEEEVAVNGHAQVAAELAAPPAEPEQTLPPGAEAATEKLSQKRSLAVAVLIGSSVAIVIFALVVAHSRSANKSGRAFQQIKLIKQTSSGNVLLPTISHDGKYMAYVAEEGDLQSLWIRQVVVNSGVQVVAPAEVKFVGVAFSPDDNHLYYLTRAKS